jgi:dTDP-4-amino-4,6-dideoxygalactose transaminase
MVAPVLLAGYTPAYFGIRSDGLPNVHDIALPLARQAHAIIVSHYFGLAQSLREVRAWCDTHDIALIEDCAHCYFGQAGERPIGAWGDYCAASLSKFFPVPEAGLLGSASRLITPLKLERPGLRAQIKGLVDVLETATRYRRLTGLNQLLSMIFNLKLRARGPNSDVGPGSQNPEESMFASCDMSRINQRPLAAAMQLRRVLPRGRIIALRQRNFELYGQLLNGMDGARALVALPAKPVAPYVFPLWVDDADQVYHMLRGHGLPVFRWDRIWPGTPELPHDIGPRWSRHVLQLLCHQDLTEEAIRQTAAFVQALSSTTQSTRSRKTNLSPC